MSITDPALYRLMTWLSPSYPIGAFSYSHGMEYAVEAQLVIDRTSLIDWIQTVIERGAGCIDGALFAAAWRAASAGDDVGCDDLVTLATAWRGSSETALESTAQGDAFIAVTRVAWPDARLERLAVQHGRKLPLSIAVGAASAFHGIALQAAVFAFLQAFAANLVSAGVRLIPLGQTDGQRAIAALEPIVARAAATSIAADLDEIGTAAPLIEWCSLKHETQYTRLYRS